TEEFAWYKKSAELGNTNGMANYGIVNMNGMTGQTSYSEALEWLTKAADAGSAAGQYTLAVMYVNGYGVTASDEKALELYRKSAAQNYYDAKDRAEAAEKRIAEAGPPASASTASAPPASTVQPSKSELEILSDRCLANDIQACVDYFDRIRDTDPNAYGVAEWICVNGRLPEYCLVAGQILYSGINTPTDRPRAYDGFRVGCDYGDAESCYWAATMLMNGDGVEWDIFQAQPLMARACSKRIGDSCAQSDKLTKQMARGVGPRNPPARGADPEEMVCDKTRVVGNGGRTHTAYDCRKRREWNKLYPGRY
ncbi:MAG: tetratricopeptide repeat protein, partial [Henriciella sp.]|uniref:tetratricopeptide repeat protein n=1 Tax=Henriciella sp. TaxID=1968823 RepID=UPI003C796517